MYPDRLCALFLPIAVPLTKGALVEAGNTMAAVRQATAEVASKVQHHPMGPYRVLHYTIWGHIVYCIIPYGLPARCSITRPCKIARVVVAGTWGQGTWRSWFSLAACMALVQLPNQS